MLVYNFDQLGEMVTADSFKKEEMSSWGLVIVLLVKPFAPLAVGRTADGPFWKVLL